VHCAQIETVDAPHLNETVRLPGDCGGRLSRYSRNMAASAQNAAATHWADCATTRHLASAFLINLQASQTATARVRQNATGITNSLSNHHKIARKNVCCDAG
jgi:hypothetical protein